MLTIDAQGKAGILSITSGAVVTVFGLTLADGSADFGGGAIINHGSLALTGCTVSGNTAHDLGGGIDNYGTLALTGCTVSGNTADFYGVGGGIDNSGTMTLTDCTVAGNTADLGGGGLYNSGTLTLTDCTVAGNAADLGGGIESIGGNVTLANTIVADDASGGDVDGAVSGSHNLIGDAASSGGLLNGIDGNIVGVAPNLGVLAYNGGPTQTMALLPGSPAIDAGDNSLVPAGLTNDQRGALRIKGAAVDIGAFESGTSFIVVTTLSDSDASGETLRQAIDYVNNYDPIGGVAITFAPGLQGTLTLTQGPLPEIEGDLAIVGPGANMLTIDGQDLGTILWIQGGSSVLLDGLTLTGGVVFANPRPGPITGGAIANWGTLSLLDCTVTGNGGVAMANYGTLGMTGCTVSNNSGGADYPGGGLYNKGILALANCTVANNFAFFGGGGILNAGTGTVTLYGCTIAGNTAHVGSGANLDNSGTGTMTLDNTIVAEPHGSGGDIGGTVSGDHSLIDGTQLRRRSRRWRQRQPRRRRSRGSVRSGTTAGRPRPWRCSPAARPSTRATTR